MRVRVGCAGLTTAALFFVAACTSSPGEEPERATLDVELSRVQDGMQASFTAMVPDGAQNVELWFGDGETAQGSVQAVHTYGVNAPYQASLFYDDALGGGRVNVEVNVEELPVPLHALALPEGPATHLVALNHYIFLHNYESNAPAHTWLRSSEAVAFEIDAQGTSLPVADASIDFYPTREVSEGRTVALTQEATRSWVDLGEQPHVLNPGWTVGGARIEDGGFTMPQVSRTDAPEPDVPHFLANAEFPVSEDLVLRLRLPLGGGVHGMAYTLVGPQGSTQIIVDNPAGNAAVTVPASELATVGTGVVGLFTVVYSEMRNGDMIVRNNNVGYAPIWLVEE